MNTLRIVRDRHESQALAEMMAPPEPLTEADLDALILWKQSREPVVLTDDECEAAHCATEIGAAQDHSRLMREDRIVRGVMVALFSLGVLALLLAIFRYFG